MKPDPVRLRAQRDHLIALLAKTKDRHERAVLEVQLRETTRKLLKAEKPVKRRRKNNVSRIAAAFC